MAGARTASVSVAMNQIPHDDVPPAPAAPTGPAGGQGMNQGMNQGMQMLSYLIAGIGVYGFLGWLGDHLLGTGFLLPIGIVAGAGLGIYLVIRRVSTEPGTGSGDQPDRTTTQTKGRV